MMPGELIIDHWVTGPWRFASDAIDGEVLEALRHPFGEGEVMCMFWANYYCKFPRVIHSIDTDVMPLAVHMLTIVDGDAPLLWKYNAKTHMDLRALTNTMYRKYARAPPPPPPVTAVRACVQGAGCGSRLSVVVHSGWRRLLPEGKRICKDRLQSHP